MGVNPYRIEGPALISFSGGRTSAYMLWHILDAHDGKLPDDVHVCFANTGKEREETLRFVHECETRWSVRVNWLEFVTNRKRVPVEERFNVVGYNSASRGGEPFLRLIALKKAIPSTVSGRWCTEYLKVSTMADFMGALGYREGAFSDVIGFRADEYDRVIELPAKPRNAKRRLVFPLATVGIRKADILTWWASHPFDLGLERGTGNCGQCPFLSRKARVARVRLFPEDVPWWSDLERAHRGFTFGEDSFADIERMARESPLLPLSDIEADAAESECFGWCDRSAA